MRVFWEPEEGDVGQLLPRADVARQGCHLRIIVSLSTKAAEFISLEMYSNDVGLDSVRYSNLGSTITSRESSPSIIVDCHLCRVVSSRLRFPKWHHLLNIAMTDTRGIPNASIVSLGLELDSRTLNKLWLLSDKLSYVP